MEFHAEALGGFFLSRRHSLTETSSGLEAIRLCVVWLWCVVSYIMFVVVVGKQYDAYKEDHITSRGGIGRLLGDDFFERCHRSLYYSFKQLGH